MQIRNCCTELIIDIKQSTKGKDGDMNNNAMTDKTTKGSTK